MVGISPICSYFFLLGAALLRNGESFNIDDLSLPDLSESFGELDEVSTSNSNQPSTPLNTPLRSKVTSSTKRRKTFPQSQPQVCVCFLSCCGRTDLLQKTMQAAVKHFEEDEPDLAYELAWVDNGSPDSHMVDASEVEHIKLMDENMGLAWGLNTLLFDLCTAPYVLILEEDWMYMDATVAEQTPLRRKAVSRAIEVAASNTKAYDGRSVMGVFLRPETYGSFLKPPFVSQWQRTKSGVEHKIYCADITGGSGYLWGSFTNGAGLYSRSALENIGFMFGEPGDGFHDAYVEANYAYRAGLQYCHSMLRMEEGCDTCNGCNAAFYHIGGGRGTRPNKKKDIEFADDSWVFYGTPSYAHVLQMSKQNRVQQEMNAPQNNYNHEDWSSSQRAQQQYQAKVSDMNSEVFAEEQAQRETMLQQAHTLKSNPPDVIRQHAPALASMSDQEILDLANQLEERASSPHPLPGFWDGMGHPLKQQGQQQQGQQQQGQGYTAPSGYDDFDDEDDSDYTFSTGRGSSQSPQGQQINDRDLNRLVFEKASALKAQAQTLKQMGPTLARQKVPEFKDLSDADILRVADNAEQLANNNEALLQLVKQEMKANPTQYQQPQYQQQQQQQQPRYGAPNSQNNHGFNSYNKNHATGSRNTNERIPQQPEKSTPLPLHIEQDGDHNRLAYEAELWSKAAHEHERAGHRAFTGDGYQEQYKVVQEGMRQRGGGQSQRGGFFDVVRRAIFGPGAY